MNRPRAGSIELFQAAVTERRMKMALGPLAMLLCLSYGTVLQAADRFEDIRDFIRAGLVSEQVPSMAVAVAKDGHIIWEEGFGYADRESRAPATEHTMYSLASISKPFTSTALMTLVQAGKIDLDRPVNDYLGDARLRARVGDANDATVRRIANHTSGLPLHYHFFYADEPFKRPSMDETILRYGNLVTLPGEKFQYSNLGFGVLDYVIERASGRSYAEFMRTEVFLPLGLTHTSVHVGAGLEAYAATRYGKDGLPLPAYEFDHPGGSAIYSSAHDLIRFGMFHLRAQLREQKAILSDASVAAMQRRTAGEESDGYGIGFAVATQNGHRVISHTGGMAGVSTSLQLFPDQKLAIVALSNSRSGLPFSTADRIAAKLLRNWTLAKQPAALQAPPFAPAAELIGTWQGTLATYVRDVPMELRFLPSGEVHARVDNQLVALVNRPNFKDGVFSGEFAGRIGTPDTERYEYTIKLSLRLRGEVLNGAATAANVDAPRTRNGLTHWLAVTKQKS
jgi:CubicO group peptidase (beta-lactamase class C family)